MNPFGTDPESRLPGQRLVVLSQSSGLKIEPSLQNTPLNLPDAETLAVWPVQHGNAQNLPGHIRWDGVWTKRWSAQYGAAHSSEYPLQSPPIIAGDQVFILGHDYTVTALDMGDGAELWQSQDATDVEYSNAYGGGLALAQGMLVVTTGYGDVFALSVLTGEEQWRISLRIPIRGSASIHQNQAVVQTLDSQAFAFDLKDGTELWYHAGISEITSVLNQTTAASDGSKVYLAYNSGEVVAIDPSTGEPVWLDALSNARRTSELAQINTIGVSPVVSGEALLISGYGGQTVMFNASNGQRIWEQKIGTLHLPIMSGDNIFILSNDGWLYALDLYSGALRWSLQPDAALHLRNTPIPTDGSDISAEDYTSRAWSAPMLVNDHLLLLAEDGTLLEILATAGVLADAITLDSGSLLPVQIVGDTALILETNGTISAYK